MRILGRIQRLEHASMLAGRVPATCEEALRWTHRFRKASPANAAVLNDILAWGRRHHGDYIPTRLPEDVHAGDCMMSIYMTVIAPILLKPPSAPGPGYAESIPLLERLAPLVLAYQDRTGDLFPLDHCFVDWYAGPRGKRLLAELNYLCARSPARSRPGYPW